MKNKLIAYFKIARISNLPTVWTNCLVGFCYAQTDYFSDAILIGLSLSLFYIAGMFLNDYCDTNIDRLERPERPIPSGILNRTFVLVLTSILFIVANLLCYWNHSQTGIYLYYPLILTAAIVVYDFWHKKNPLSPFFMALCRFLVYLVAASCFTTISSSFYIAAACSASYIIGLTYAAKQENLAQIKNLWPLLFLSLPFVYCFLEQTFIVFLVIALLWTFYSIAVLQKRNQIGKAVGYLIAGISLIDAMLISTLTTNILFPWLAIAAFVITLIAQKYIPGT